MFSPKKWILHQIIFLVEFIHVAQKRQPKKVIGYFCCHRPFDTLFSICNEFIPPSTKIEATMIPLVISSLKSLENHLLCSNNIS
jgi:hypothetical protein